MVHKTLGHDLGSAELIAADKNVDVGAVLCEVCKVSGCDAGWQLTGSLLASAVATTDNGQRLLPEDGNGTVADGASRDTGLPVLLLSREIETLGGSTSSDNDPCTCQRDPTSRI